MKVADKKNSKEFSRRDFLKTSGAVTGGFIGGSLLGGLVGFNLDTIEEEVISDNNNDTVKADTAIAAERQEARIFFKNPADFEVLSAATEIIYPEDENGPGAIGLGVPFFIDKQLAGEFGYSSRYYLEGPFLEGENPLTNANLFMLGLRKLNQVSNDEHDAAFNELSEEQQISILESLESDEIEMDYVPASTFFHMLRITTIQGAYADPLYGGNKNMEGWKMKEWPGAQTSYRNMMSEDAPVDQEFTLIEPISLSDNQ